MAAKQLLPPASCYSRTFQRLRLGPPARVCAGCFSRTATSSSGGGKVEAHKRSSDNDNVSREFVNRNPRNLELMLIERKDKGWEMELEKRNYYHRVELERTKKHTTLRLVHRTGLVVVSASTKELAISKHLYGTRDTSALENVARVLASRCLQAGITAAHFRLDPDHTQNQALETVRAVVEREGMQVQEGEPMGARVPPLLRDDWSSPFSPAQPDPTLRPPEGVVSQSYDELMGRGRKKVERKTLLQRQIDAALQPSG